MTALPLRDFSDAEQDKLAAIEAAPAAEESLRERVARAIWESDDLGLGATWGDSEREALRDDYRANADAAIAVLSGPSSDAERAVERCLALADEHADCCQYVTVGDLRRAVAGD